MLCTEKFYNSSRVHTSKKRKQIEKETRKIRLLEKIRYLFNTLYFDSWTMLLQAIAFGYKVTKVEILPFSSLNIKNPSKEGFCSKIAFDPSTPKTINAVA